MPCTRVADPDVDDPDPDPSLEKKPIVKKAEYG